MDKWGQLCTRTAVALFPCFIPNFEITHSFALISIPSSSPLFIPEPPYTRISPPLRAVCRMHSSLHALVGLRPPIGTLHSSPSALASLAQVSVTIGQATCAVSILDLHNTIKCTLPPGCGADLPVVVTVDGQTTTWEHLVAFEAPQIKSATPNTVHPSEKTNVCFEGTNFFSVAVKIAATLNGAVCTNVIVDKTHTRVCLDVPPGSGDGIQLALSVCGQAASGTAGFGMTLTYYPPQVVAMKPVPFISTAAGVNVAVTGRYFGLAAASVTVMIGPYPCIVLPGKLVFTDTTLECVLVKGGVGTEHAVVVTRTGQQSNTDIAAAFEPPVVDRVARAPSAALGKLTLPLPTVGGKIEVYGSHFGTESSAVIVTVGGAPCTSVVVTSKAGTAGLLECVAAAGTGTNHLITVVVAGQYSDESDEIVILSYAPPSITKVSGADKGGAATGGTRGGARIKVDGDNFGAAGSNVTVAFVNTELGASFDCVVESSDHRTIVCVVAEGIGRSLPIRVVVSGQDSLDAADGTGGGAGGGGGGNIPSFSYLLPVIKSVVAGGGVAAKRLTAGGFLATIHATNLGPAKMARLMAAAVVNDVFQERQVRVRLSVFYV